MFSQYHHSSYAVKNSSEVWNNPGGEIFIYLLYIRKDE